MCEITSEVSLRRRSQPDPICPAFPTSLAPSYRHLPAPGVVRVALPVPRVLLGDAAAGRTVEVCVLGAARVAEPLPQWLLFGL